MTDHEFATRLRPSTDLWSILVHEYLAINYQQVAASIPLAIEQYGEYVRQVARWLQRYLESAEQAES